MGKHSQLSHQVCYTILQYTLSLSIQTDNTTMITATTGIGSDQTHIATLTLPNSITNQLTTSTVSTGVTVYKETGLFPVYNGNSTLGSPVVSVNINGISEETVLEEPVIIVLKLNNITQVSDL